MKLRSSPAAGVSEMGSRVEVDAVGRQMYWQKGQMLTWGFWYCLKLSGRSFFFFFFKHFFFWLGWVSVAAHGSSIFLVTC